MKKLLTLTLCAMAAMAAASAEEGLVAYYPMNGNFDDVSGNGHHLAAVEAAPQFSDDEGIKTGNKAYGPTGNEAGGAEGKIEGIDIKKGLTVMGFYNSGGNNTSGLIFGFGDGKWHKPGYLVAAPHGVIGGKCGLRGETFKFTRIPRGWHHLALVVPAADSGEKSVFYVNGEKVCEADTAYAEDFDPAFRICIFPASDKSSGKMMDEIKVYNRPLSAAEVVEAAKTLAEKPAVPAR